MGGGERQYDAWGPYARHLPETIPELFSIEGQGVCIVPPLSLPFPEDSADLPKRSPTRDTSLLLKGWRWKAQSYSAEEALDNILGGAHRHYNDIICLDLWISSPPGQNFFQIHGNPVGL
jgi:hypothetical protein